MWKFYTIVIALFIVFLAAWRVLSPLAVTETHAETSPNSFIIEEFVDGSWKFVSATPFPGRPYPDRYTTEKITLPIPSNQVRIKHTGGTESAHLDQVVLENQAPILAQDLAENINLSNNKFATADYDVVNVQNRTIELSWERKRYVTFYHWCG